MYSIQIKIGFRAAHRLLPPYKGKCNNIHGEGFTAIFHIGRQYLDENGMVVDFGKIKKIVKKWIDDNLDHAFIHHVNDPIVDILDKHLDELNTFKTFNMGKHNPTSENIAKLLFDVIKMLLKGNNIHTLIKKVEVIESFEDSIASYEE